jgi:hypothetical protein
METSRLYDQLQTLLGQSIPVVDKRHLQTLIWMVIGLICSVSVSVSPSGVSMSRHERSLPKVINGALADGCRIHVSMCTDSTVI